jgi:2-dehydropantoate 2-reductase
LKKENKKIVVVGAGSVGCFFGGLLARSGADVTLIARENHVAAINKNGLYMDCLNFKEHVKIKASLSKESLKQADLILCCVKSPDTDQAIKEIKPHLKSDAIILSMQNGVDNVERIKIQVSNPVYPAVVYVATAMAGDGHVKHFGRGELVIGDIDGKETEASQVILQGIANIFGAAQIPCAISKQIKKEMWLKFLVNCCYNGISAIGQISYGELIKKPEIQELIGTLTEEFLLVASFEKVNISPEEANHVNQQIALTMADQKSSTAQDLIRKRKTEIQFLNGLIVRKAGEYGVQVPTHQAIFALVKMLEIDFLKAN